MRCPLRSRYESLVTSRRGETRPGGRGSQETGAVSFALFQSRSRGSGVQGVVGTRRSDDEGRGGWGPRSAGDPSETPLGANPTWWAGTRPRPERGISTWDPRLSQTPRRVRSSRSKDEVPGVRPHSGRQGRWGWGQVQSLKTRGRGSPVVPGVDPHRFRVSSRLRRVGRRTGRWSVSVDDGVFVRRSRPRLGRGRR